MAIGFGPWAAAALGSLAKGYGEGQKQKDEINQAAMEAYLKQKLLEMQQQQADDAGLNPPTNSGLWQNRAKLITR